MKAIMAKNGTVTEIPESMTPTFAALAGCGPAYVRVFFLLFYLFYLTLMDQWTLVARTLLRVYFHPNRKDVKMDRYFNFISRKFFFSRFS